MPYKTCIVCGRQLGRYPKAVYTQDGAVVSIGSTCYKRVREAGEEGFQAEDDEQALYLNAPQPETSDAENDAG